MPVLKNNLEEADTHFLLHASHAAQNGYPSSFLNRPIPMLLLLTATFHARCSALPNANGNQATAAENLPD